MLRSADRLGNQHIQAAFRRNTAAAGVQHKPGAQGVVDHVRHAFQTVKRFQRQRLCIRFRIHSAGCRVQDDLRVGMIPQGFLIGEAAVPAGAADLMDLPGAKLFRREGRGPGSAAGAGNQDFFAGQVQTDAADEPGKPVQVRVEPVQFSVPVDDGVYRADRPGGFIDLIQERDHCLLVGNRDVDPAERPGCHERGQLFRGQFLQFVGVSADLPVDLFGEAVGQMLADAAVGQFIIHNDNQSVP